MKKILVAALAVLTLLVPAAAGHASTQDFTVTSFTGDYYLSRGAGNVAEMRVDERIVAKFPDFDQNHGILRAIPEDYQGHPLELTVQKVTDSAGTAVQYSKTHENGNLVLKMGDPDKYVHGEQTYNVSYTMRGVSLNLADHQEFFWDINGDQWQQPFGHVTARVHVPKDLQPALQADMTCYTGPVGSKERNCTIMSTTDADGANVLVFTTADANPLQAGETLSVVVAFNKGTFGDYSPSAGQIAAWAWLAAQVAVPVLFAIITLLRKWRKNGRDPKGKGVIVPQYLPPKGVSVLSASAVLREGYQSKAVSATIIDLAVRHYFKIYETQADAMFKSAKYELELVKLPDDLQPEEQAVVSMLFGTQRPGARVKMDDLKTKLAAEAKKIGTDVNELATAAGYFRVSPDKATTPYYALGTVLLIAGFILTQTIILILFGIGLIAAGAIFLLGARVMPARTERGVELRDYLLGIRDYMKLAEEERIKVLQSPHGSLTEKVDVGDNKQLIKLYEKLLPYAMLFNIEKDWAREMADLYKETPDWYVGTSPTFNAVWFASSLSGFTTSAGTAFTAPSSSSSSGFGGGAGGGGGGGGGGGW